MRSVDRHIHRHFTIAEIEATDRCVACGAAQRTSVSLDFAEGASTLYMKAPLPQVPLCGACVAAQRRAVRLGRRALALSLLAPAVLVVMAAFTTPLDTPLVLPGLGLAALVAARVVLALVRRARALDAPVLYIDGAIDQVILQLPPLEKSAPPGYRDLARDVRDDGRITKMHGARIRAMLGFVASTAATALASLVGWFGAYPVLVLDDSSGVWASATIDGKRIVSFRERRVVAIPVPYGHHTIAFGDGATVDLRVPFGANRLVSSDPSRCHQVRWRSPANDRRSSWDAYTQIVSGRVIPIDLPDDVASASCPKVLFAPDPGWLSR